jgi:chemotaxis protein MotB
MARHVVQPIIRKKKRRASEEAHHGGAWKIAYADFVTAMMAFFLLMWLINVTSPEQKTGIAEYFNPITVSQTTAGSGGVLSGASISAPGPLTSPTSEMRMQSSLQLAPRSNEKTKSDASSEKTNPGVSNSELDKLLKEREQQQFKAVEEKLRKSIEALPDLKGLLDNLIIDQTPEGLRIQLVDRDDRPLFALGSAEPFDYTQKLLTLVTQAIADLPNAVSIKGHTDALPYASGRKYDNWDLSSERALASRRVMKDAGLADDRVEGVIGRADRDPLFPQDPKDPRNRRISIILLHGTPEAAVGPTESSAVAGMLSPTEAP